MGLVTSGPFSEAGSRTENLRAIVARNDVM